MLCFEIYASFLLSLSNLIFFLLSPDEDFIVIRPFFCFLHLVSCSLSALLNQCNEVSIVCKVLVAQSLHEVQFL